jgi:hypothetical protein
LHSSINSGMTFCRVVRSEKPFKIFGRLLRNTNLSFGMV